MTTLFFERDDFEGNAAAYSFVLYSVGSDWQRLGQIMKNSPISDEVYEILRHLAREGVIEEKYCSERHNGGALSWFEWRTKQ